MTNEASELQAAVANADAVFARYRLGGRIKPAVHPALAIACLDESDPMAEWLFSLAEDVVAALMSRAQPS